MHIISAEQEGGIIMGNKQEAVLTYKMQKEQCSTERRLTYLQSQLDEPLRIRVCVMHSEPCADNGARYNGFPINTSGLLASKSCAEVAFNGAFRRKPGLLSFCFFKYRIAEKHLPTCSNAEQKYIFS